MTDENEDTSELEWGSQAGAAGCLIYEGELLFTAKLFYDFFYLSHLRFQRFLSRFRWGYLVRG